VSESVSFCSKREDKRCPAWLANINFLNDQHSPTDSKEWEKQLIKVKAELGIASLQISYMADIFLEARDRSELSGAEVP